MSVKFAEVIGFGSGFALGAAQSGMDMVAKCERPDSFGASNAWANRELLGPHWELQVDREGDGSGWDTVDCDVILGNPPCSGFSTLTQNQNARGIDAKVNEHMHALISYAGRTKPELVMWESVQGTYRQGIELMNLLHEKLEEATGFKYQLTHVLHNNLSLGGCAMRRRYFWVASRVPFGVEPMDLPFVPTADDALHDLEPLAMTWNAQPYRFPSTRWSDALRSRQGVVDGHQIVRTPNWSRASWVAENLGGWPEGKALEELCREHYDRFGCLPGDSTHLRKDPRIGYQYPVEDKKNHGKIITREEHLRRRQFSMGPTQLNRWRADRHAYVITGGALTEYVHPHVLRTFTHREAARIMGFPDDWRIAPQKWDARLSAVWGKGVPVHSGRWVAEWAKRSLEGNPGTIVGEPDGSGARGDARVINLTNDWHRHLGEPVREYYERTR